MRSRISKVILDQSKVMVSTSSLIVNEGGDGDGWGINAGGAGDILLQTRDASANTTSSDVFINADVR